MMKPIPAFALFGDFAATLLAVSLLVFVVVLAPNAAPPSGAIEQPRVAEATPGFHRQAPLGGVRAVDFLYALRVPIAGTLVELHGDHAVIVTKNQRREVPCPQVDATLLPSGQPVRVAVFSAICGARLFRALAERPMHASVLSVPQALKAPAGDDWSKAFKRLLTAELDRSAFAERLAQILSRATSGQGDGTLGGLAADPGPQMPGDRLVDRFIRKAESVAAVVLVLCGVIVVAIAERRRLRVRQVAVV